MSVDEGVELMKELWMMCSSPWIFTEHSYLACTKDREQLRVSERTRKWVGTVSAGLRLQPHVERRTTGLLRYCKPAVRDFYIDFDKISIRSFLKVRTRRQGIRTP